MPQRWNLRIAVSLVSGALAIGGVHFAVAQERGGLNVDLSVTQSLEYSDNPDFVANPDNAGFLSNTRLGFSLSSITKVQEFSLSGAGTFEVAPDSDAGFTNSNVRLRYTRANSNSQLSVRGDYRRVDLDDVFSVLLPIVDDVPVDDIIDVPDPTIIASGGSRTQSDLGFSFVTGLSGPITFRLNLSAQDTRYVGTTDPDLFDNRTRQASITTSFRLDPTMTARLVVSRLEYDTDDITESDRTITRYGAGLNVAVNETLTVDSFVGYRDVQTSRLGTTTTNAGPEFSLGVSQALRNGTVGLALDTTESVRGRRTEVRVTRALVLANEAALSYSLGALKNQGLSVVPLAALTYTRAFKLSEIRLAFAREGRTNSDNQAVTVSRLNANYARPLTDRTRFSASLSLIEENTVADLGEDRSQMLARINLNTTINTVSSWSANLTYSDTDIDNPSGTENQQRVGVRLGYRRSLTEDWSMVSSLEHARRTSSAADDRRENSISFGLSRDFSYRP
jgi:hypothetical protein